ncbi:MAG: cbb3-type cytochrome oxidase assembly protein CcoS [Thermodesulfobacteriota bacterium]
MNIIFLTLGISITMALVFLVAFIWATKKGQYDDLTTPSERMLLDDYEIKETKKDEKEEKVL